MKFLNLLLYISDIFYPVRLLYIKYHEGIHFFLPRYFFSPNENYYIVYDVFVLLRVHYSHMKVSYGILFLIPIWEIIYDFCSFQSYCWTMWTIQKNISFYLYVFPPLFQFIIQWKISTFKFRGIILLRKISVVFKQSTSEEYNYFVRPMQTTHL